jgi:hypothetical protein
LLIVNRFGCIQCAYLAEVAGKINGFVYTTKFWVGCLYGYFYLPTVTITFPRWPGDDVEALPTLRLPSAQQVAYGAIGNLSNPPSDPRRLSPLCKGIDSGIQTILYQLSTPNAASH